VTDQDHDGHRFRPRPEPGDVDVRVSYHVNSVMFGLLRPSGWGLRTGAPRQEEEAEKTNGERQLDGAAAHGFFSGNLEFTGSCRERKPRAPESAPRIGSMHLLGDRGNNPSAVSEGQTPWRNRVAVP